MNLKRPHTEAPFLTNRLRICRGLERPLPPPKKTFITFRIKIPASLPNADIQTIEVGAMLTTPGCFLRECRNNSGCTPGGKILDDVPQFFRLPSSKSMHNTLAELL